LEDEKSWEVFVEGTEYGAPTNSRASAMRGLSQLARRYEHRKTEAIEHLARFARETRGTAAGVFRGKMGAIRALKSLDDLAAVPVLREIAVNEIDGRMQRMAEDSISALRESAKKPKEIKEIRSELDDIITENKSLRDRLDILEIKENAKKTRNKKKR